MTPQETLDELEALAIHAHEEGSSLSAVDVLSILHGGHIARPKEHLTHDLPDYRVNVPRYSPG